MNDKKLTWEEISALQGFLTQVNKNDGSLGLVTNRYTQEGLEVFIWACEKIITMCSDEIERYDR